MPESRVANGSQYLHVTTGVRSYILESIFFCYILESRVTDLSPDLYVTYWSVAYCIPECTVTRYILESRVILHVRAQSYT